MKHILTCLVVSGLMVQVFAYETCTTNGYTFSYTLSNGMATYTGDTKDVSYSGDLIIPAVINGHPVAGIGEAFNLIKNLKNVYIENGIEEIGHAAFYRDGSGPDSVTIPPSVVRFTGSYDFRYVPVLYWTVGEAPLSISYGTFCILHATIYLKALGGVPKNMPRQGETSFFNTVPYFTCTRQHAREWIDFYDIDHFMGIYDPVRDVKTKVVSCNMRKTDPTIMDVVYRVDSVTDRVKVRALAYQKGAKSFSNVIRPERFTSDTMQNIGDAVLPNRDNLLSWYASADIGSGLSDVVMEIMAIDEEPLSLDLTTIPANGSHGAVTYSWNILTTDMVMNALYWYYANAESDLTLSNGILKWQGTTLASGTSLSNPAKAVEYVFGKMGYGILSGSDLDYVKSVSGLSLSPSGVRQYAVRK